MNWWQPYAWKEARQQQTPEERKYWSAVAILADLHEATRTGGGWDLPNEDVIQRAD